MKLGLRSKLCGGLVLLGVIWILVFLFSPPAEPPAWVGYYEAAGKSSGSFKDWDSYASLVLKEASRYGGKMPPPEPISKDQKFIESMFFFFPMQDRGETLTYPEALRVLGGHCQAQNKWEYAVRFYRTALDLEIADKRANPKSAKRPNYSSLIDMLNSMGKTKEALELQNQLIAEAELKAAEYPDSPDLQEDVLREKATAFEIEGKFDDAEKCWKEMVDLRKSDLTDGSLARVKNKNKNYDGQRGVATGLCTLDKLGELARFYKRRNNYIAEEQTLAKSLSIRQAIYPENCPPLANYWDDLAGLYEKHQQYDQAEKAMLSAIHCAEDEDRWEKLAQVYVYQHKYDQAANAMFQSLSLFETDKNKKRQNDFNNHLAASYIRYAKVLEKAGKKPESKLAREKAHQLDPSVTDSSRYLR